MAPSHSTHRSRANIFRPRQPNTNDNTQQAYLAQGNGLSTHTSIRPHDALAFQHHGSWAGDSPETSNVELEANYASESSTHPQDPYYQQYTPLSRQWTTPRPNGEWMNGYAPAPSFQEPQAPQGYATYSQAPSRQYAPSTAQPRTTRPSPRTLNTYNQHTPPRINMNVMVAQDQRHGPYDAVGYTRQDGEFGTYRHVHDDTGETYGVVWEESP